MRGLFLLVVWHDFFNCHFCAVVLNFNVTLVIVRFLADQLLRSSLLYLFFSIFSVAF